MQGPHREKGWAWDGEEGGGGRRGTSASHFGEEGEIQPPTFHS